MFGNRIHELDPIEFPLGWMRVSVRSRASTRSPSSSIGTLTARAPGLHRPEKYEIGGRLHQDDIARIEQCFTNQINELGRACRHHGPGNCILESPCGHLL